MSWFRRLWAWVLGWFRSFRLPAVGQSARPNTGSPRAQPRRPTYSVVHLAEDPDHPRPNTLYAIGENARVWQVIMICPCGCGATIGLNTLPDDSPRWTLHERADGPALVPSVWRTTGCLSHFILRGGEIIWCHDRRPDQVREVEYGA